MNPSETSAPADLQKVYPEEVPQPAVAVQDKPDGVMKKTFKRIASYLPWGVATGRKKAK